MNINGLSSGLSAMLSSFNIKGDIKPPDFKFNQNVYNARFTPSNTSFSATDWNNTWTKKEPEMSEDEYIKAIQEQAAKDYANGYRRVQSEESKALFSSYVQVMSSDRKTIYEESMSMTGGKLNVNGSFFDSQGRHVLQYAKQEQKLMTLMVKEESSRARQFQQIYYDAYVGAMKGGNRKAAPPFRPVSI